MTTVIKLHIRFLASMIDLGSGADPKG